jgi:hypothetical protein
LPIKQSLQWLCIHTSRSWFSPRLKTSLSSKLLSNSKEKTLPRPSTSLRLLTNPKPKPSTSSKKILMPRKTRFQLSQQSSRGRRQSSKRRSVASRKSTKPLPRPLPRGRISKCRSSCLKRTMKTLSYLKRFRP